MRWSGVPVDFAGSLANALTQTEGSDRLSRCRFAMLAAWR